MTPPGFDRRLAVLVSALYLGWTVLSFFAHFNQELEQPSLIWIKYLVLPGRWAVFPLPVVAAALLLFVARPLPPQHRHVRRVAVVLLVSTFALFCVVRGAGVLQSLKLSVVEAGLGSLGLIAGHDASEALPSVLDCPKLDGCADQAWHPWSVWASRALGFVSVTGIGLSTLLLAWSPPALRARPTVDTNLVFISYVREDEAAVQAARDALVRGGIKVFLDVDGIDKGADVEAKIFDALSRSALLLCWASAHWSSSTWTSKEYGFFRALERPLVPVWPDEAVPLPTQLQNLNAIRADRDDLVTEVRRLLHSG